MVGASEATFGPRGWGSLTILDHDPPAAASLHVPVLAARVMARSPQRGFSVLAR